ncbi:thiol reductant ABC exporter subunit CydD [Sneathiella sp.]|uniref:thiol reductant ABC exporter subunit CydD n=1 Tax=Sneathiella sp. TaxID=1964365 RepID=UPI003568B66E
MKSAETKPEIDKHTLKQMIAPIGKRIRAASALGVASSSIWPLQAAVVASAIAGLLPGQSGGLGTFISVAIFSALGLLRAGLTYFAEGQTFKAGLQAVTSIRREIVEREMQTIDTTSAASTAALATEKLDMLVPYIIHYAPAHARVIVLPLILLAITFWFSWAAGIVLLITGPLIPVFMALVGMAAKEASQRQMEDIGTLNNVLIERLSALTDIKLLDASTAVIAEFSDGADRLREKTMRVLRIAFLSSTVLELFSAIGVAMMAVYVGFELLGMIEFGTYVEPLSPAAGIFLLLLAPDFYQPMRDFSAAWHDKASALAVAGELAKWRAETPQKLLGQGANVEPLSGAPHIKLQGLVVNTGSTEIRYSDIKIVQGESVALMGPSGVGKTTLLKLLAGLLSPDEGKITVSGQPLNDETADAWRARMGWMPQVPHFLNMNLAENISLGQSGDLNAATRAAAIDDVIAALPGGLQTHLGETGGGLSGGEARRITLARALFAMPDILLVDEPTADLDEGTAKQVMAGLALLINRGCTLIVATHDPVLAAMMDRTVLIGGAS